MYLRRADKIIQLILFSSNTDRSGKSLTRAISENKALMNDDKTDTQLLTKLDSMIRLFAKKGFPMQGDISVLGLCQISFTCFGDSRTCCRGK